MNLKEELTDSGDESGASSSEGEDGDETDEVSQAVTRKLPERIVNAGVKKYTTTDSNVGVRTAWEVGPTRAFAGTNRQLTTKKLRGVEEDSDDDNPRAKGPRRDGETLW